ncbi:MAG: DUF4892 domain-containing protein [Proteobacteria bacterium]|nr:DUF4892 domain-containing protein [Pseudomonadota bacterium]
MRKPIIAAALGASMLLCNGMPVLAKDVAGSKDHPLVGRYQGSEIISYKVADFDAERVLDRPMDIKTANDKLNADNSRELEGRVFRIRYVAPKDRSTLEIIRNYEESLKSKGFQIVFSCANQQCIGGSESYFRFGAAVDDMSQNFRYQKSVRYLLGKLERPEGDVYAAILVGESREPTVRVTAVELKPMQAGQIAFVDASQMEKAISATGRVALYGIHFDTDKADIKPESKPTLDEMAKFLKANPSLNVIVAGHTDSQGGFDYNIDLSRRRAASVVQALAGQYGIAPARLAPFGAGMAAPVAVNDNEAGRAKNRRVELVKR